MKKIAVAFGLFIALFILCVKPVNAEEIEEPVDEPTSDVIEDEETLKDKLSDFLSQYMNSSFVAQIITWLVDAGVLSALVVIYAKYRKYKDTSLGDLVKLIEENGTNAIKEKFAELSDSEFANVKASIEILAKSNETIMKVLVLMQDSTASGKVALLDYLGSKTNSDEIKQASLEVGETIKQEEEVKQEVLDKVAGDYESIF